MHRIVELERRLARLEANRGASLRFGEVVSVSPGGFARVRLPDGDGMVSAPLRIVQRRTLKDKDQCFPDVGEHVACLFAGQGMEQGLILGAVYSTADPAAGQDAHMGYYQYEDGTILSYDRNAHKLVANVQGEVEVKATKTATVEAEEGITATTPRQLVLEGGAGVVMRGPTLSFEGAWGAEHARPPSTPTSGCTATSPRTATSPSRAARTSAAPSLRAAQSPETRWKAAGTKWPLSAASAPLFSRSAARGCSPFRA